MHINQQLVALQSPQQQSVKQAIPEEPSKKKGKENKKTGEVKKACSSFIHFSTSEMPKVKQLHPDLKQVEIMREIGSLWNRLNEEQKQPYIEMAERDKLRYQKEVQMQ